MKVEQGTLNRLIVSLPVRHGKQLADSTPIATPTGWTRHGDLKPGELVFDGAGLPTMVLALSPPSESSLLVTFDDGSSILAHPLHEWKVYARSERRWRIYETRHLARLKLKYGAGVSGRWLYQVKRSPLQLPEANLPVPPYVLGAWLGDGSAGKSCITHSAGEWETVEGIEAAGYKRGASCPINNGTTRATHFYGLSVNLRAAGVYKTKSIPQAFLRGSIRQRLDLLAGLVDTDGHVDADGRVRIVTCDPILADGIRELSWSLGWRISTSIAQPSLSTSGIQGRKEVITLGFTPTCAIPTRVPRKRIAGRPESARRLGIASVRPAPPEVGRCIQVASSDGTYLAGRSMIPTHNSELTCGNFPAWYIGLHPDQRVGIVGYGADFVSRFGRMNRAKMERFGEETFGVKVDPRSSRVDEWDILNHRGGLFVTGIGGGVTGRGFNCMAAGTFVQTPDGARRIEDLGEYRGTVLAYNEMTRETEYRMVEAWREVLNREVIEIEAEGHRIRCTPDHRIAVAGRGYVAAGELRCGDALLVVQGGIHPTEVRGFQGKETQAAASLLLESLLVGGDELHPKGGSPLPVLQRFNRSCGAKVLRSGVSEGVSGQDGPERAMRLRDALQEDILPEHVLLSPMRQQGPRRKDARPGELPLFKRQELREVVSVDEAIGYGAGRLLLSGLPYSRREANDQDGNAVNPRSPSHQRGHDGQPGRESYRTLRAVPHSEPQVTYGQVRVVRRLHGSSEPVYDLQVEGCRNFFANGVLVHNCIIIDDPFKSQREANSISYRDMVYDYYRETLRSRLEPGGSIIVIMSRWHEDDLVGRLLKKDPDGWVVLDFPAIAMADDPLGRAEGEALWPERWPLRLLQESLRDQGSYSFNAQFQGRPTSLSGGVFKRDWFRYFENHGDRFVLEGARIVPRQSCKLFAMVDLAASMKTSADYFCIEVFALCPNGELLVLDVIRKRIEGPDQLGELQAMYRKWRVGVIGIEDAGYQLSFVQSAIRSGLPIKRVRADRDKLSRALPVAARMESGQVYFDSRGTWLEEFESEILVFPKGANDDQVDPLSYAGIEVANLGAYQPAAGVTIVPG